MVADVAFRVSKEYRPPFWAACRALSENGVLLAQLRGQIAGRVIDLLVELRANYGTGHLLGVTRQSGPERVRLVALILRDRPETWTSVTPAAVEAAVVAAVRVLVEG